MSERLSSSPLWSLLVMAFLNRLCYVSSLQLKFYISNLPFTALNRCAFLPWTILYLVTCVAGVCMWGYTHKQSSLISLQMLSILKKVPSVFIKWNEVHRICFRQGWIRTPWPCYGTCRSTTEVIQQEIFGRGNHNTYGHWSADQMGVGKKETANAASEMYGTINLIFSCLKMHFHRLSNIKSYESNFL